MSESSTFRPNWTSPPGETISDMLKERQLSVGIFAKKLNQSQKYIEGLLKGYEIITDDIAKKLEGTLGGSSDFWLTREFQYREDLERVTKVEQEAWLKELPIKDMISFGWISGAKNLATECLTFFNVANVKTWRQVYNESVAVTSFRKSPTFKSEYGAVAAWLRQGEVLGEQLDCKPWNARLFEKTLEEIKPLTRKKRPKDFLPALTKACAECGVAVAIVRTPTGCRASGATRFVAQNRALLLLSFRYLSDDQFWFTFFHEAGHLLLHGSKAIIIEGMTEVDDYEKEREANLFAGEILIPHTRQQQLSRIRGNKRDIINFAMSAGVSPGIVVGQMQHHGYIDKKYLNTFKRRYSWEEIL
jgi:HTH-type transcriptional regulator / antitoxin HigA